MQVDGIDRRGVASLSRARYLHVDWPCDDELTHDAVQDWQGPRKVRVLPARV